MKKSQIVISILCYVVFAAMWICIGFFGFLELGWDTEHIIPSGLKVILVILALSIIISPVYIKISHPKRAYTVILITLAFVAIYCMTKMGIKGVYSNFTPAKWENHIYQRHLMIDSLENKYEIKGMNSDELKNILGEPDGSHSHEQYTYYDYIIGDGWLDPIVYSVIFENDVVINTSYRHT